MKKEIDIIIPAYKAHNTIFKTLCSIAEQTFSQKIQVTIINDCCPEGNYKKIIDLFKGQLDIKEIKLKENGGPGVARQFGLANTKLPYVMFMDADDCFMGPYIVSQLVNVLKEKNEDVLFSNFIEEHENDKYVQHFKDRVWMFGKIYKREFLNHNKIKFSNRRANEDTCFNKMVLLTYQNQDKELPYLEVFTYGWNYKENSITRVNNAQYTYDQCMCGYIDGMIEVYEWADRMNIKEKIVKDSIYSEMCFIYISFCDVAKEAEYYQKQNFEYIKKFYHKVWKKYIKDFPNEDFLNIYDNCLSIAIHEGQASPRTFIAQPNFMQFIEMLENVPYDENEIYKVWAEMPAEIKQNNIDCGVVDKNYYNK